MWERLELEERINSERGVGTRERERTGLCGRGPKMNMSIGGKLGAGIKIMCSLGLYMTTV